VTSKPVRSTTFRLYTWRSRTWITNVVIRAVREFVESAIRTKRQGKPQWPRSADRL